MKTIKFIFCMLTPSVVFAADGVLEINQTCATQLGCFSGDAVGYPINIDGSAGRSYRLTSDLIVPDQNTDGILIAAPSISIDLNGFEIVRSGCEGATANCLLSGTGSGINVSTANRGEPSSNYHGVSVRNGSITGMGRHGVYLSGRQSVAINLRVRWNGASGIFSSNRSHIISNNAVYANGVIGIETSFSAGSIIKDNLIYDNVSYGIRASDATIINGNTVYKNTGGGIRGDGGSIISENIIYDNIGVGIVANRGSSVNNNTLSRNTGFGLDLTTNTAFRENVLYSNGDNTINGQVDGGVNMGDNFCVDTVCP